MRNLKLFSFTLLWTVSATAGQDLADQIFGEALLKSLSPSLREKLEEIHGTGAFTNKSESQAAKHVKAQLTPDDIKELEAAYKRLILPMLQDTLEKRIGRKYENLDDIPIEFEEEDEPEDEKVDDFKTESEEIADRKTREMRAKENRGGRVDSPRTVSADGDSSKTDNSKKVNGTTNDGKGKGESVEKANHKKVKEEL